MLSQMPAQKALMIHANISWCQCFVGLA